MHPLGKLVGREHGFGSLQLSCSTVEVSNLAQSEATENPDLVVLKASIEALVPVSMENEEYIIDVPFTVEVEKAIKQLKRRKAPGPDNLLAEHLIEGGQSVEANAPHVNQSAYKKKVSCADAIFATQDVIARYLKGGSRVYTFLYDLLKAFDSIDNFRPLQIRL